MSEFDSKDFGERIKNYRIKKGLSQENIATSLGKSKAIVSRYEKGQGISSNRKNLLKWVIENLYLNKCQ